MKEFWRKPTFVETILFVVIVALALHVHFINKDLQAIDQTMEIMGLSDELVTTHMVQANTINFKLLDRIERLEHYDSTQVEFNEHILNAIAAPQRASW